VPAPRVGYRQHVEGLRMLAHELVDALVSGDVPENSEELPQIVPPGVLPGEQDLGGLNPELRGLLRHDQRQVGIPRALGTTARPPASGPLQNLPSQPPHCESRDASGLRRAWVDRRNYRKFASRWRDRGGRPAPPRQGGPSVRARECGQGGGGASRERPGRADRVRGGSRGPGGARGRDQRAGARTRPAGASPDRVPPRHPGRVREGPAGAPRLVRGF